MRTNDFTAEGINEQNPASVKALNFLLTPFYMVDDMLSYLGRVIRCALVAWLFETDMNSAGVLLWKYYQHVVWVTDNEDEAEALEDDEEFEDEDDDLDEDELVSESELVDEPEPVEEPAVVHPPLSRNFVTATAPTIPESLLTEGGNYVRNKMAKR